MQNESTQKKGMHRDGHSALRLKVNLRYRYQRLFGDFEEQSLQMPFII